jgi:hypothetical protein
MSFADEPSKESTMDVYILSSPSKRHLRTCRCGRCDDRRMSWSMGIWEAGEPIYGLYPKAEFWGRTIEEAARLARAHARQKGWTIRADVLG